MNLLGFISVLLVMVNVGRLHDAFARYTGSIPAGKVLLLLGAFAFLLSPSTERLGAAFKTIQARALIVFAASIFISVPFSYHRSDSLGLGTTFMMGSVPILLITVAGVADMNGLERLFRAAVLMVIFASAVIGAGFGVVMDGPDGPRTTLMGAYDPNDLALVIASCIAFCVWAIKDRSKLWRILGYVGIAGGTYVVVRTYSRGGALALGTLIFLATFALKGAVPGWFRTAIMPMAFVAFLLSPAKYRERVNTLTSTSEDYNSTAETGRIKIWKRGVGYFLTHPVTGVGAGQFSLAEGKWGDSQGIRAGWKWSAPHNMYVEAAAEMGILGIGGLLGMLLPTLVYTWRRMRSESGRKTDPRGVRASGAIFLAVSTFMVGAMFLTAAFSPLCVFLAALGIAFQSLPHAQPEMGESRGPVMPQPLPKGGATRRATRWQGRPAARVRTSS